MDIAIPRDLHRKHGKELVQVEKYQELKREIRRICGVKNVDVMPAVVGALKSITKTLGQWIE